ncbi:MAG TPA: DUF6542 domain-containing protein [Actinomycetes bacterium]
MTASPDTGELPVVTPAPEQESPLIPSPTEPTAWYVSLVPPQNSLPLDFDPLARGSSDASAETSPADAPPVVAPAPQAAVQSPPTVPAGVDPSPPPSKLDRVRAIWSQGLPTPLAVLLAVLVMAPGVVLDVARDGSFGLPSTVLFLLAAIATPLVLRPRSLAVGVVLPPLTFVGAAAAIAWRSGLNAGTREIGLDVGTTMALQAPLLFLGTTAALGVVLARLLGRLVRR